jgi:hypothetical protein
MQPREATMSLRQSAIVMLSASTLWACGDDVSPAADLGVPDAWVTDAASGSAASIRDASPRKAGTSIVTTFSPGWVAMDVERVANERARIPHMPTPATVAQRAGELDAELNQDALEPFPGLVLASSIAGIRGLVGRLNGGELKHGAVRILHDADYVLAFARALPNSLDASIRTWRRREVRVLTTAQECEGRVAELEYATSWIWKDELLPRAGEGSQDELDAALRESFDSVLAHVVLDDPKACRGRPVLIQDAAQPGPRVARALHRVPRQRAILRAIRGLPRYREIQSECRQESACPKDAAGAPADRAVELRAFHFPGDSSVQVVASIAEGACGEWAPPLSAIFVLDRGAPLALRRVNESEELGAPFLLLDLGADDRLELVTRRYPGEIEIVDETGLPRSSWTTHYAGCRG